MKPNDHASTLLTGDAIHHLQQRRGAFIEFIKSVFDAEEILRVNSDAGSPMHCEYSINGGTIMFGQAGGEWKVFPCGMFVVVEDEG